MPGSRAPTVPAFARRLAIETPEHLMLEIELAGPGSRVAAAACDAAILFVILLSVSVLLSAVPARAHEGRWATLVSVLFVVVLFVLTWGYFLLFEAFNDGRTPGKRLTGIRVVMDTGHRLTLTAAAVRNLVRVVDAQPLFSYLLGFGFVLFHPQNKRLGDIVAGTIVVRDRPGHLRLAGAAADAPPSREPHETGPPELADEEFRLIDRLLERWDDLEDPVRRRFTADLVARFASRFPRHDPDPEAFLVQLHRVELDKRRGRLAARYREVAADLARARTYGVDPRVLEYLERVVSAGHNALYGRHTVERVRLGRLLLRELPAAVVGARAYVLVALLSFALPAATGYLLIRERPAVAEEVLPTEMLARAKAGAEHRAEGVGYAQAPSLYLPVVATRIITNNVQVAFFAFAFGITAGIGTLVLLVLNGLFFGAVLGLFANHGLAGWLLTFVAGHGVLELTAIFVAGGAGLLVARALVAPGDLTRRDAIVLAGRHAVRMVGAAVALLVVAGTIEGLLSASDAPAAFKYATSALSVVLLFLYFESGWEYARGGSASTEGPPPRGRPAEPARALGREPRQWAPPAGGRGEPRPVPPTHDP